MVTVPATPSAEALEQLQRARDGGQRKMMDGVQPHGARLSLFKAMVRVIDTVVRPPRSDTVHRMADVPAWWIAAANADEANGVLLHLHGGAFVLPPMHRAAAAEMPRRTGMPVVLSRHRHPPAHPFPAAADDALAAYRAVLEKTPAAKIGLSGDASGGFLALALLGDLQRAGLPLPGAVYLASPIVDLSGESAQRCDKAKPDPVSPPLMIARTNKAYAGDTPLTDPRLAALEADLDQWPPMLVQVGETECLTEENTALADRVNAAGGRCGLQVWPAQSHGFPTKVLKQVPEAEAALDYAVEFLVSRGSAA